MKDMTGNDLRDAIIAMAVADVAVTNDSGLMHIAAALNTPTIAIFGPTSPRLWSPLNPLAAMIEPLAERLGCQFTDKVAPRLWDQVPALAFLKPAACPAP